MARNSATLWDRIELTYFRRLPPFRAWKRWLSFGCAFGAIGWVAALAVREDETPYASGPTSSAHRLIANDCYKCHVEPWRGVKRLVTASNQAVDMNQACLVCHAGSIAYDHSTQTARHVTRDRADAGLEPPTACDVCHREHEGPDALLSMPDDRCVRCHADLRATHGATAFAGSITGFTQDHPEFRVLADHSPDPGRLKLNHALHLKPGLMGPNRKPVQMTCADCHRAREGAGDDMEPVRYAAHCASCHALVIDSTNEWLPDGLIPHESPEVINNFLRGRLHAYADDHPDAMIASANGTTRNWPTLRERSKETEQLKTAWVDGEIQAIERKIYRDRKDCLKCHEQQWPDAGDARPVIVPPNVPERWFAHAAFSHERHEVLDCDSCHTAAVTSETTADVLLPGIALCQICHASPSASRTLNGADDRCILCHTYHHAPRDVAALPIGALVSDADGMKVNP